MCRGQYFHASPGFSALSLHCITPCGESCLLGVFASFSKFSSKGVSFFVSLLLVVFWKECKDGGAKDAKCIENSDTMQITYMHTQSVAHAFVHRAG